MPSPLFRISTFVIGAAISLLFFINFCDLVYQCGCRSFWNGAAEACNIHLADSRHCPWCSYGSWGLYLPASTILLGQAVLSFWPEGARRGIRQRLLRLLVVLLAFPVLGGLTALAFGLHSGYWA